MRRRLQVGSALLLLIVSVTAIAFVIWEYRRYSEACRALYARSIKKRDIIDTARNAYAALNDAEVREQDYVLTGETVYAAAYSEAVRQWVNEEATLELVARNDPTFPLVGDLSKSGTRTLEELALVVSLYEKSGRAAAIERIRKSSGIVYLDEAKSNAAKIQSMAENALNGNGQIGLRVIFFLHRLMVEAVSISILACVGALLAIFAASSSYASSNSC